MYLYSLYFYEMHSFQQPGVMNCNIVYKLILLKVIEEKKTNRHIVLRSNHFCTISGCVDDETVLCSIILN